MPAKDEGRASGRRAAGARIVQAKRERDCDAARDARAPVGQRALCPAVRSGGGPMTIPAVLDTAGRRRSPATMPGYHAGRPPRNKGQLYPTDPPTVEEIVAVMREANDDRHGWRLRALIVVLWRGGLRVQEALALGQRDLDARPRLTARAQRQGRPATRDRHGRLGLRAAAALARRSPRAPARPAVLCHRRPHPRATVVKRQRARRVPPARRPSGYPAPLRTTPAAPRPRRFPLPRTRRRPRA
jgi:integrase